MIITEWLNTGVDDLRSTLRSWTDARLFERRQDFLDTAAEASARGHRTRFALLLGKVRSRWQCRMCSRVYLFKGTAAPTRSCPGCGCRLANNWRRT